MAFTVIIKPSPYEFDTDGNGFPTFTEKNIAFLNGILRYDSNYSTSSDKDNPEYRESYAGLLEDRTAGDFFDFDTPAPAGAELDELGNPIDRLYRVIASIDKINSTHLSSEGYSGKNKDGEKKEDGEKHNKGRALVADEIRKLGGARLKELLEKQDDDIVGVIANKDVGGKHNFSFATKFCSYVSIHSSVKSDNYCIYDEVLQSVLPYYAYTYIDGFAEKYAGDKAIYRTVAATKRNVGEHNESLVYRFKKREDYGGYRALIDDILEGVRKKVNPSVGYEELDHLIWYCFKSSKSRIRAAMESLPRVKP